MELKQCSISSETDEHECANNLSSYVGRFAYHGNLEIKCPVNGALKVQGFAFVKSFTGNKM